MRIDKKNEVRLLSSFPIDIVYCWCNSADDIWNKKRIKFLQQEGIEIKEFSQDCRFINNDELKYSLRSIEKYAPWINHIYIISDHQRPNWLNVDNSKITFINHEDILPKENLPLFNSEAIETALYKIPNLSEHFLYANDDCFFGDNVRPSDFFNSKGQAFVRLVKNPSKGKLEETLYGRHIKHMQELIKTEKGKSFSCLPHHNIDAYIKTEFQNCTDYFKDLVDATAKQRFRKEVSFQRAMIGFWMICSEKGIQKNIKKWKEKLLKKMSFLAVFIKQDSIAFNITSKSKLKVLKKVKPKMFCLNDCENATIENRLNVKIFMKEFFPEKSQFEL